MSEKYASFAVFDLTTDSNLAISAISITPNESVLSGAWVIPLEQRNEISTILSGKLAIPLSEAAERLFPVRDFGYKKVSLSDFFTEAKRDAESGLESFESFKAEDPKKRKNLVRPEFFEWNEVPDLLSSWKTLTEMGLPSNNEDCAPEMRIALGAGRLVQYFISQWHNDERSRSGRRYLEGEEIEITILPKVWLD
jgi:hypothetical protein